MVEFILESAGITVRLCVHVIMLEANPFGFCYGGM